MNPQENKPWWSVCTHKKHPEKKVLPERWLPHPWYKAKTESYHWQQNQARMLTENIQAEICAKIGTLLGTNAENRTSLNAFGYALEAIDLI